MNKKQLLIASVRFGIWSTLGLHMYTVGLKAGLTIMAPIASIIMFGYAGSIILEAIFRMNKESNDVREDQELDAKNEFGGVSSSDAERSEKR